MFQRFWIRVRIRLRQFFKFELPTPVQTPATIIDPTEIYICFYLRKDRPDSCYCQKGKLTPDPGPVFLKFLTPGPGPNENRRIPPDSTPALRIRSHLWRMHRVIFYIPNTRDVPESFLSSQSPEPVQSESSQSHLKFCWVESKSSHKNGRVTSSDWFTSSSQCRVIQNFKPFLYIFGYIFNLFVYEQTRSP